LATTGLANGRGKIDMNATSETIVFLCKGCGKEIVRPANKVGVLVSCSKCNTTNRTPGIAMQVQATASQLARMQKTLKRFRLALWVYACAVVPVISLAVVANVLRSEQAYLVASFLLLGLSSFVLFVMMDARSLLGYSRGWAFVCFIALGLIWLGMTIWNYFRFKRLTCELTLKGARLDSADQAG
jgi:hypothetical protein